ncbi:MAG: CDP-alcohol phosphatidyltransferase family protein [Actinobacteria bacterium]|nr:CDP-alcohol phosphatidyltransferase family protein [Actinomycetota bacterium]
MTTANVLTISRLLAVPVYLYIFFAMGDGYRPLALVVFGLAALTDYFDGFLARRSGTVTEFGKIADPLVDRVLIMSAVIALYIKAAGFLPVWAVAVVVGRDILMLIGAAVVLLNRKSLQIKMAGKVATAIILVALSILTIDKLGNLYLRDVGLALFYLGLAFSLITGLFYLGSGTKLLLSKQGSEEIPV